MEGEDTEICEAFSSRAKKFAEMALLIGHLNFLFFFIWMTMTSFGK